MTSVLVRNMQREYAQRRQPWKEGSRDDSNADRTPTTAGATKSQRRLGRLLLSGLRREGGPDDTFISDAGFQICERINFCCFKPPNLLWQLWETNTTGLKPTSWQLISLLLWDSHLWVLTGHLESSNTIWFHSKFPAETAIRKGSFCSAYQGLCLALSFPFPHLGYVLEKLHEESWSL